MIKSEVIISNTAPKAKNIVWAKPDNGSYKLFTNVKGTWEPFVSDGGGVSPEDITTISQVYVNVDDSTGTPSADTVLDGQELTINFHNIKGGRGPQGDSFQPIEDVSGLLFAHVLGGYSNKVMSQKGVTDALNYYSSTKMSDMDLQTGCYKIEDNALSPTGSNKHIIVPVDNLASVTTVAGKPNTSLPAIIYLDGEDPTTANIVGSQFAEGTSLSNSNAVFNSPLEIPSTATHAIINRLNGYGNNTNNAEITIKKSLRDIISEIATGLDVSIDASSKNTHGTIGEYYPEQINDVEKVLSAKDSSQSVLHFLHISDNHRFNFGHAEEFLDTCPAKFLVNTGDMVHDNFTETEDIENTISLATAPIKPVYLVLGNHDYYKASAKEDVFDAFIGATNTHNGTEFDKSYYSIDYDDESVKCIMLDMNEGLTDEEISGFTPIQLTNGSMSQTQINWFIAQLQDAAANNLHVCIFIHTIPSAAEVNAYDKVIDSFSSGNYNEGTCCNLSFLLDIVDAFINGGTHNIQGNNITFSNKGHFVAWFAGHKHRDVAGWLTGHNKQFAINVCTPAIGGSNNDTYDGSRLGVHFNYVTVNTTKKTLAVYRVGQQKTIWTTERKSFKIAYE